MVSSDMNYSAGELSLSNWGVERPKCLHVELARVSPSYNCGHTFSWAKLVDKRDIVAWWYHYRKVRGSQESLTFHT